MDEMTTVVQNTSGVTMTFSFLPPHGVRLANNDTYSWVGGLTDIGGAAGQESASRRRSYTALQAAITDGLLTVVKTPSSVYFDATADAPKVITVDNETVAVADPSWVPAGSGSGSGS